MSSMTKPERDIAAGFRLGFIEYDRADRAEQRRLVRRAKDRYSEVRVSQGLNPGGVMFTKPDAQPKTGKSERYTLILMMLPASEAGMGNLCPPSTEGCRKDCLNLSGHGEMPASQAARLARTVFMVEHPFHAAVLVAHEITLALARFADVGVRLNGTTDLRWELIAPEFIAKMTGRGCVFYDYTKWPPRLRAQADGLIHLTYSAHERETPEHWADMVLRGYNVALVSRISPSALIWEGRSRVVLGGIEVTAINGDLSDDRTLDKPGVLVLLGCKGNRIWSNTSGFVYTSDNAWPPRTLVPYVIA